MFLSIITPFFNNIDDVERCISRLEKQTCLDFELILIDDASTEALNSTVLSNIDNCPFHIQLIKNATNSGPGHSRNKGIAAAQGDYVLFLDSDDWLDNNTTNLLKECINENKYDCVLFDYFIVKENIRGAFTLLKAMPQSVLSKRDALLFSSGSVCCKLYRTNLLRDNYVKFPNLYIKEDMAFNKNALSYCETIFYMKRNLYYYRRHRDSLMYSSKAYDVDNDIRAFKELERTLSKYYDVLEGLFVKELLYAGVLHMLCANKSNLEIQSFIAEWTGKYPEWIKNPYIKEFPLRMKILLWGIIHENWFLLRSMAFLKKTLI